MNANEEPTRRAVAPGLVWPGVAVAFLAIWAYLAYRPPLETARPEGRPGAVPPLAGGLSIDPNDKPV